MKKTNISSLSIVATALLGLSATSQASSILIDFGASAGVTTGNYNNVNGNGTTGASSISDVEDTYSLIDSTGASAGQVVVSSNTTANWGDAASGANYTGTKPVTLSGIAATATDDGLYMNNAGAIDPIVSLSFTGLAASQTYDILFYSARGNNGGVATNIGVTTGTGTGASISNSFNNDSDVGIFSATTTASGELTLTYTVGGSSSSAGALNFMSITAVPEPSSTALLGLGGLALILRRRRA
ncbi:PEP-CTERM sorting domain-containing protein [Rubritalea spongiae]|uniref:PEP-CTERM sorting domain-containing protein n=1 Tax=Rubritalea spongiae TaxID=430797 RepID=A0ABW5E2T0_9BACT